MIPPEAAHKTPKAGRNLPVAIGVGIAVAAPFVAGLLWSQWLFIIAVTVMLCLATIEVSRALARKGMKAETWPIFIGTAVSLIGVFWVSAYPSVGIVPMTFMAASLGGTVLAALTARLFRGVPEGFIGDFAASAFVIAYIPMIGMFVSLLMAPDNGTDRIWTLIACVIASDTGAFATGVLLGKHKMAPKISPSKTWEGFAGGIFWTAVVAAICCHWVLELSWWMGIPLGIVLCVAATIGDLVESLIKRDAGIKDMSNWLPAHGGVMDRLDSMLMAFPVGWFFFNLTMGS